MPVPILLRIFAVVICLAAETAVAGGVELPEKAPLPQPRPDTPPQEPEAAEHSAASALPAIETACRKELRALGVSFAAAPPVETEGACALPYPIEVAALSPTIRLEPAAVLNCATVRAAARLFQGAGMTAARKHFDARITAVHNASAYVCRPINGAARLSQHAFGNALDVSGFTLSDDRHVPVRKHEDAHSAEAEFLQDVRAAACGRFTTVLGPGTDADHNGHFHFDMKKRRRPYCR